jgi:hypothetical protein
MLETDLPGSRRGISLDYLFFFVLKKIKRHLALSGVESIG